MRKGLWTTAQAAEYLGVSASTLRSWRKRGKGPAYKQPATGVFRQALYEPEVVELFKLRRDNGHAPIQN